MGSLEPKPIFEYSLDFAITTYAASCAMDLRLNSIFTGEVCGFFFFLLQPQMSYVTARGQMPDTVTTQNKCIISIFIFFLQIQTKLCYLHSYLLTPKIITIP